MKLHITLTMMLNTGFMSADPFFEDKPVNSPDLKPVENLWAIIKQKLKEMDI